MVERDSVYGCETVTIKGAGEELGNEQRVGGRGGVQGSRIKAGLKGGGQSGEQSGEHF
jgi:hypothetical protein